MAQVPQPIQTTTVVGETTRLLGSRSVVTLLPTLVLTLLIAALIAAGAPRQHPRIDTMIQTFHGLRGIDIALWSLALAASTLVLQPFQIAIVQLLEGYWEHTPLVRRSRLGKFAAALGVELQRRRHRMLDIARRGGFGTMSDTELSRVKADFEAYPECTDDLMPTRLGNILRATERKAGERYGLETVLVWPRLYAVISERLANGIAELNAQLDAAAHLCIVFLLGTMISLFLLLGDGWWLLVPAASGILAWLSYRAALSAARHQSVLFSTAFDLHRFDLLAALHYRLPRDSYQEIELNRIINEVLGRSRSPGVDRDRRKLQEVAPLIRYFHRSKPSTGHS